MASLIEDLDRRLEELSETAGPEAAEGPWALLPWAGDRLIHYRERDGWAVAEGDLLLGRIDEAEIVELSGGNRVTILGGRRDGMSVVASRASLWVGAIPYECSESLEARIRAARHDWNVQLGEFLPLVERTDETDYVVFEKVAAAVGSWSAIGRVGNGPQPIRLARIDERTILHEVCHAAGLFHEHNRPDRNDFISVTLGAVPEGRREEVDPPRPDGGEALPPYDFDSITHYRRTEFSAQPFFDVTPKGLTHYQQLTGSAQPPAFGGQTLSPADVQAIRTLYGA